MHMEKRKVLLTKPFLLRALTSWGTDWITTAQVIPYTLAVIQVINDIICRCSVHVTPRAAYQTRLLVEVVALAAAATATIHPAELVAALECHWHTVPVLVERAQVVIALGLSMHATVEVLGLGRGCWDSRLRGHCICDRECGGGQDGCRSHRLSDARGQGRCDHEASARGRKDGGRETSTGGSVDWRWR